MAMYKTFDIMMKKLTMYNVMNEFTYITNGSTGAPTNITLNGLG